MSLKTRLSVLFISTPVLAFVLVGGLLGNSSAATNDESYQHLRVFSEVVDLVMNNYVTEVKADRAMEGAMRGLADGLDPDSAYLTPQMVKALDAGEAQGDGDVGIELTRQYYLRVIATRDGSPGAKANLQTGDYIRGIDGKPTRDMSVFEGSRLLRGKPGTKVTVTVIRGNAADPHEIALVREKASAPLVTSRTLPNGMGYLRIVSFRNGVTAHLLGHAGIQKLVKLPEGRGLWLTYARYLRPDGEQIQGRGIQPDLEVDEPAQEFGEPLPEKDAILEAAIEHQQKRAQ